MKSSFDDGSSQDKEIKDWIRDFEESSKEHLEHLKRLVEKEPEGAASVDPAPQFLLSQEALRKALDGRYEASSDCDNQGSNCLDIEDIETPLNLPEVTDALFQGASHQQRQRDKAIADLPVKNSFALLSRQLESTLEERLSFPS